MQVTVAAPTRHDLPEGRTPHYYGGTAQDWNPYHPDSVRPLAYVARDLVRSLNYQADILSFDDVAVPHDGKQAPTRPEILLVDRWALHDEEQRERLAAFDAEHRPWVSVVVPWNREDQQSRAAEVELGEQLERTMPRKMGQGRTACRAAAKGVPSMEAFGQILPQVVEAAAQQYLRHAAVYPPAGGSHTERPRLRGPMAAEYATTHYIPETHDLAPDAEDTDDRTS
jgi:FxsC-like protein